MTATSQNASVLLKRVFSLKEQSNFLLCTDTLAQSGEYLISEFIHNLPEADVVISYVSFEHMNKPVYATNFVDASTLSVEQIIEALHRQLDPPTAEGNNNKQQLIIIDAINYIPVEMLAHFLQALGGPMVRVLAIYHRSLPVAADASLQHYPDALQLLSFIANTILEVEPITKHLASP